MVLTTVHALRRAVAPFVEHEVFGSMLQHTGSVVSGSVAVRFLDGDARWEPDNMDIFTPLSRVGAVVQHLRYMQGYSIVEGIDDGDNTQYHLAGSTHIVHMRRGSVRVNVYCSQTELAQLPITYCWGTGVMNYLTATAFLCAYPEMTFARRTLITPFAQFGASIDQELRTRLALFVERYARRGYEICFSPYELGDGDRMLTDPCICRSFEDPQVFCLQFGGTPDRCVSNGLPREFQWYVHWWLGCRTGGQNFRAVSHTLDRFTGRAIDVVDEEHWDW